MRSGGACRADIARCSIQEDAAAQDLLRLHGRELRNMVRLMDVLIELREQTLIKLKTTVEQAKARDEFKRDLRAKIERVRAAAAAIGASAHAACLPTHRQWRR